MVINALSTPEKVSITQPAGERVDLSRYCSAAAMPDRAGRGLSKLNNEFFIYFDTLIRPTGTFSRKREKGMELVISVFHLL